MATEEEGSKPKYEVEEISIKTRVQKILDLSTSRLESRDDLEVALGRIPQYKIKPEKAQDVANLVSNEVRGFEIKKFPEDMDAVLELKQKQLNVVEKKQAKMSEETEKSSIKKPKVHYHYHGSAAQEMKEEEKEPIKFDFQDPSPPPMKACEITYLSSAGSISWKYLTPKRPHDAKTEPFFSRMIELDGRSLMNRKKEAALLDMGRKSAYVEIQGVGQGGVREKWIRVCQECADEFCGGECSTYQYSHFERTVAGPQT